MRVLLIVVIIGISSGLKAREIKSILLSINNERSFQLGLPNLQYSGKDNQRIQEVFQKLGGVSSADTFTSSNVSYQGLRSLIRSIRDHVKAQDQQVRFVFYYSGHSDADGLHLTDRILPTAELHNWLDQIATRSKLIFLDSCFAGALTSKGVSMEDSFAIPKAHIDEPTGSVFIAATSESEFAYEIKELKGSLFTHYLVAGLYGQADSNQDGLVTLEEIYQFVFREMTLYTLSLPGASRQRPEMNINLKGRGALAITKPMLKTVELTLSDDLYGSILLAQEHGAQMFRISKDRGSSKTLRILPGSYTVVVSNSSYRGKGTLTINGANSTLSAAQLTLDDDMPIFLVSKGHLEKQSWVYSLGLHQGIRPISHNGAFLDILYQGTGISLRGFWLKPVIANTIHQNNLRYKGSHGVSTGISSLIGVKLIARLAEDNHRHWLFSQLTGGYQLVNRRWQQPPDDVPAKAGPKVAFTLGYQYTKSAKSQLQLLFRREGIFLAGPDGDTIAFSASLIGVGFIL